MRSFVPKQAGSRSLLTATAAAPTGGVASSSSSAVTGVLFSSSLSSLSSQTRCFGPGADWALTDEQRAMAGMAKEFAQQSIAPHAAQWDAEKTFPVACLKACAEQGFAGIYCPPEVGGMGLTRLDASLIFEQLAAQDPSTTAYLTIHNMCAWMVSTFSSSSSSYLKEVVAPKLCAMEWLASYCLTEPTSGSDAAALRTTAATTSGDDDTLVINGSKAFISGAGAADVYVVMVRTGDPSTKAGAGAKGISCVVIMKDDPGVSFGKNEAKLGWNSQPTRIVNFENVKISKKERLVGSVGEGFTIAMKGLDGGRINIATCSLGAAQRCLDLTVDYTKDRKQFNTALSGFQNTQFQLADMAAKVHGSRLMVRQAAQALDAKDPNATTYCAMAKMTATEQCFTVADTALQLHGGYGYLKDFPIERYLRDLRVHRILEGTNEVMRMIVARTLIGSK